MARFDVYEFKGKSGKRPYLLDVQAEIFDELESRIIIPLTPEKNLQDEHIPRLKPKLKIGNTTYLLVTTEMGSVDKRTLGKVVANLSHEHYKIVGAIDFLLQGF